MVIVDDPNASIPDILRQTDAGVVVLFNWRVPSLTCCSNHFVQLLHRTRAVAFQILQPFHRCALS